MVYQRTQAGIDALHRDMDARLTDLTEYIEQLEESILNNEKSHAETPEGGAWALVENAEERFHQHEQRLDDLDVRLSNTLQNMNTELEKNRAADRKLLQDELTEANVRNDKLLTSVSDRLEASINGIEERLSSRLSTQTAGFAAESQTTVEALREQLGSLIDERVKNFNADQSEGLVELRDTLLSNTQAISGELKLQTEEQRNTLSEHRSALEAQFNAAITTLNNSKVSHRDLSDLLSRIADRIKLL